MSGRIRVYKGTDHPVWPDWYMDCSEHEGTMHTCSWVDAYEAALGHACMWHPKSVS